VHSSVARILIIDPEEREARTLDRLLIKVGHTCDIESDPGHTIARAEKDPPDLFVIAIMMTGLNGFELCRRIRRHPTLYTLPIMVVSAMADKEEVQHGLAQGADDYLPKLADPRQVVQRIHALLDDNRDCLAADPVTGLFSAKRVRREIQHRIAMQMPFGAMYIEMGGLRAFGRALGPVARDGIVAGLGKALYERGHMLGLSDVILAHMGAGHFLAILSPEVVVQYAERIRPFCQSTLEGLYASLNAVSDGKALGAMDAMGGPVDVLVCATTSEGKRIDTPRQLFDILLQLRQKAMASRTSSNAYLDVRSGPANH